MIPTTYESWVRCITIGCGLELTPDYIAQRLEALRDERDEHTARFQALYGPQHVQRVISWFELAAQASQEGPSRP